MRGGRGSLEAESGPHGSDGIGETVADASALEVWESDGTVFASGAFWGDRRSEELDPGGESYW